MYNRSHGSRRPPTIPQNYSGNAFYRIPYKEKPPAEAECREIPPAPEPCEPEHDRLSCEKCECELNTECETECETECTCQKAQPSHSQKTSLPFFAGKLFPRGIGNEELLILALILMTSGNEDSADLLLCLVLLLFC